MNAEILFAAIGGLEASRLERTELTIHQSSSKTNVEESSMYQKKRRFFPTVLVAVLITALLATTAFAAAGFILFDNPKQMIDKLFGNETGHDATQWTVPDNKGDVAAEYHSERVPVDEQAAEAMAPLVDPVGQSITFGGHTLTADANIYDAATNCGFVTYTIENPNGIRPYDVLPDGEVEFPFGELLKSNQYGRSYIIQDQCTDTKLCATYYYSMQNPNSENLELGFTFWAAIDDPETFIKEDTSEYSPEDCKEHILIPTNTSSTVQALSFSEGTILLSSFSVRVNLQKLSDEFISDLTIRFQDGSSYTVKGDTTVNYFFDVSGASGTEETMMLNRLLDLDKVASITVNGILFEQ